MTCGFSSADPAAQDLAGATRGLAVGMQKTYRYRVVLRCALPATPAPCLAPALTPTVASTLPLDPAVVVPPARPNPEL